jgi:sialic acid synthase SpsE
MIEPVKLGSRLVGPGNPVFIIAEAGLNHNGDIEIAKRLIDMALVCGADCVKFQKRTVHRLAINEVLDSADNRFPGFGSTYREIREHIEFDWKQMATLKEYSEEKTLFFLCTPFDEEAADGLESIGVNAFKLASHSITNLPLIEHIAKKKRPTFLSSGMCTFEELRAAVDIFLQLGTPLILNHCVSSYPQAPDETNLAIIKRLHREFQVPVGYSGHEYGILISIASVVYGACAVERHITLDHDMEGFDHKISMEPNEFFDLCQGIREVESSIGNEDKYVLDTEWVTRKKYHVSIVSAHDIPKGELIERDMLTLKNPGTGMPASRIEEILGMKTNQFIPSDTIITEDMLVFE